MNMRAKPGTLPVFCRARAADSLRRSAGRKRVASLVLLAACLSAQAAPKQSVVFLIVIGRNAKAPPAVECTVSYGPAAPVTALAFSPDGKQLAVGGYKEVLLWDLVAGKLARRIGAGQLNGRIGAVAFLDKGKQLAVGEGEPGKPGAVKVFDAAAGKLLASLAQPTEAVQCLAVSPDGKYLAAGGAYTDVHVWTTKDRKLATTIKGHEGPVTDLCYSPNGKQLATGGMDRMVYVWNVGKWDQAVRLRHREPVYGVAFGPDNRSLACAVGGPSEWSVRMRRADNARSNRAFYPGGGMPQAIVWALKSWRLYVGAGDNTIKNMSTSGRVYATYKGHTDWVYALALSPDSKKLASGSADGTVRLWDVNRNVPLATFVQLAPGKDDWLVMTAPGYLATSSAPALKFKPTGKPVAIDTLLPVLQNADNFRKALIGTSVSLPVLPVPKKIVKPAPKKTGKPAGKKPGPTSRPARAKPGKKTPDKK